MTDCVQVQVALRVRPLVDTEIQRGCQISIECVPNEPQVVVKGTDKAFTFNYVFGPDDGNEYLYETAVKEMVSHVFKGYNVTILAYGQTGSGKTYSMGTAYCEGNNSGVIPRAVNDIFKSVEDIKDREFKINVSFMELYQEHIFDLLDQNKSTVDIREIAGDVIVPGLTEVAVHTTEETIGCLIRGSLVRATGATAMNAQSSRSHAIFTIIIHQQSKSDENNCRSSKFHLVDLAGSERSKKTKASGKRLKEGININRGLFALGNVISALGEECPKGYISYRDSKLTRLLQDSLGGNSWTLMIACISPADYNIDESLSTLRYADRTRRIRNKPVVNQDPSVAHIAKLRQEIHDAQEAIQNNNQCLNEHQLMQEKNEYLRKTHSELAEAFDKACSKKCFLEDYIHTLDVSHDSLKLKLIEISSAYGNVMINLSQIINSNLTCFKSKEQFQNLQNLRIKIKSLLEEQNLSPEKMFNKECAANIGYLIDDEKVNEVDHNYITVTSDENANKHSLLKRIELSKQLVMSNRALAEKQKIVDQLTRISNETENQNCDDDTVKNLKSQVDILLKEKEQLQNELLEIKHSAPTPTKESQYKLQRATLSEHQQKINFLTNKISQQNEIIKRKKQQEKQIKVLCDELEFMKKKKLKLIKQMKNSSHHFQFLKLQSEKEIMILLERNKKGQKQMKHLKKMHEKEQNILKKKLENAISITKRLKDALVTRKLAQEKHKIMDSTTKMNIWLLQELELIHSIKHAQIALDELLEERTFLTKQLNALSNFLSSGTNSDSEKYSMDDQIKQLTENISARNVQIAELQQKIIDGDYENKNKTRWDCIQNLSESKYALKYLFNIATNEKREESLLENMLKNLTLDTKSKEKNILINKIIIEEKTKEHNQNIINIEREYQEKALLLIENHINSNVDSKYKNILEEFWNKIKNTEQLKIAFNQSSMKRGTSLSEKCRLKENNEEQLTEDLWKTTPVYKRLQSLKIHNSNESDGKEKPMKQAKNRNSIFNCNNDTCSSHHINCSNISPLYKRNLNFNFDDVINESNNYQIILSDETHRENIN